ncbi:MAG: ATP phosphoribosyltransferase regulatory subunit [Rhodospirillales bacterium]|nr:ATP phosphoribosyltransferase regulatory subunit [Rhodospirillales bacterium]
MTETQMMALLPTGLADVLPPDATFEAATLAQLMAAFAGYGYERIKPPLIEFEDGLLAGLGTAMASQTFRLMDPVSQRMMGVRADMTPQVARIASTRLKNVARPLRLSYSGDVLRVKGTQLRPERQFTQVGVEIIGTDRAQADAEVILMAIQSLRDLGVDGLSVDLAIPTLVPALCKEFKITGDAEIKMRLALDRKDAASITELAKNIGTNNAAMLSALLNAAGPAERTLTALHKMTFGPDAARERAILTDVANRVRAAAPDIQLTIDPVENRGFEYHSGVTFTFFARGVRGELGNGGRYLAENGTEHGEPATGLTLFMDTILRALPRPQAQERIYLCFGISESAADTLRGDGWITISGLEQSEDPEAEAQRLRCTHIFIDDKIKKLKRELEG